MFKNGVKTVVLLAGYRRRSSWSSDPFFGSGGLVIGLALRRAVRRRVVLVLRQARGAGRRRGAGLGGRAAEALRHRPRPHVAHRHADAGDLHQPGRAAERVRHRSQPAPRGRRGHAGPAPGRRRRRAPRRARPRALARREPRHPDHVGRGRGRHGHHVRGPHGDVGRALRRHRRRRPARPRRAEHASARWR